MHNLVQHLVLAEEGTSFKATVPEHQQQRDFLTSTDPWFRPVNLRTGPDGALWVADMYRFMIEHPEWLPDEGKRELEPHFRAGEDRGRIYRVYREDHHRVGGRPLTTKTARKHYVLHSKVQTAGSATSLNSSSHGGRTRTHRPMGQRPRGLPPSPAMQRIRKLVCRLFIRCRSSSDSRITNCLQLFGIHIRPSAATRFGWPRTAYGQTDC